MKNHLYLLAFLCATFFAKTIFAQPSINTRASQNAISYENNIYRLLYSEGDRTLFVKSVFYRRDLPHWWKWLSRIDMGAVWYNKGWYLESHFLFGRPIKKVDFLTGVSLRSGNLPAPFLLDDALFLNPEWLVVVRPQPLLGSLTVEARLNMASFNFYAPTFEFKKVAVPGFGVSVGYILKKQPHLTTFEID